MARKRDPKRDEAFEIYKKHNGQIQNRELGRLLDIPEKTISGWKSKDKWIEQLNGVLQIKIRSTPNKKSDTKARSPSKQKSIPEKEDNDELTDKQRLFCFHYVKSFNATLSAIKAGYAKETAHVQGSRMLRNVKVATFIRELKEDMQTDLFINAKDVLNYYIKIAFADITDYVTFTRKDIMTGKNDVLLNPDGTVKEIVPRIESWNEMYFKNSEEIDGTIVSEVRQGRDGVSVKLVDKKWALEKLEQYFDLLPDHHKRKMEEEKLKIAQMQAQKDDNEGPIEIHITRKEKVRADD
ncbi:MAG: terminase small subunit [Bacillota bacterium]